MAGPLDIQRLPKGLIELLGMRATGDTPHQLSQQVAGELNLLDEYLADRLTTAAWTTTVAITAAGELATTTGPPPGFQWYVYGISGSLGVVAAAASIQTALGIRRGQLAGNVFVLPGCGTPVLATGANFYFAFNWEKPTIMRAGDALAFATLGVTGAPGVIPAGRIYYAEVGV